MKIFKSRDVKQLRGNYSHTIDGHEMSKIATATNRNADILKQLIDRVEYLESKLEKNDALAAGNKMLKVGDVIECTDTDDLLRCMHAVEAEGFESDFIYNYLGRKGFFLEITGAQHES